MHVCLLKMSNSSTAEISNNLRSARTVGSATKKHSTDRIQTKDSGVPDSVEDVDSGLSLSQDRSP